ncbi:MAG: toprim domain-containing protein [Clostridiales bacterium]|nr:toprim domain-containing protein [Clostridiales bacterium]MDY5514802.1 toprim domain-containing protein [Candidatus Ventricola sp.]
MTIYEWADRLGMDPHKSKSPEDFWTICPCHSDTRPSLHVYVGRKTGEIVMKCFVCDATGGDVCKALDLPIGEVMCDAMSGEKKTGMRSAAPRRAQTAKKPKLSRYFEKGKPLRVGDRDYEIKSVYEYQTGDGRVVLRKARAELWEDGKRVDKSFLIQSIGTDGKWYAGGGIYTGLLYHQPDVLSMQGKPGRTIIAEGEKDVDNLRLLGLNATCGMHGGGIDKGGDSLLGKWNDDHSKCFDGLDEVVVIADNDAAGEGISQWICRRLRDRVKTLKLLRIADFWPALPKHGDFTDWANALIAQGKRRSEIRTALETMIDETPVWEPGNIRKFEADEKPKGKAESADGFEQDADGGAPEDGDEYEPYFGSTIYCIKGGCLAQRTGKDGAARQLCSFLPVPKETIRRDDGSTVRTDYVIGATRPDGTPMEDARIAGEGEFAAMRWPMKFWQFYGNIKPVKNGPQLVLDAISTAGQRIAKHRDVYEHTGMREIGGRTVYLYNGGAIGADDVSVELAGQLQHYEMRERKHTREEAACAEMMLVNDLPGWLILPELAQAYLAPLYSVLERMQLPPSYVVYVIGDRGAGKSTVTGYVQGHFGNFYERQFPSNFTDTPNQVRDKLFWAKDSLMVIDDYRKTGDGGRTRSSMDMVADAAITAVADRADRGRLDADKRMSAPRPCRSTCIMTGEDMPNVSISRKMRLYRIQISMGDIYKNSADELEGFRVMNRAGMFRSCMRYYIEDLLARWDGIEDELQRRMDDAAAIVKRALHRKEGRYLECATHLMCGIGLMLDHLIACGVMEASERDARMERAAKDVCANIDDQGGEVDESQPEAIWLQTLQSLLATRTVTICSKDDAVGEGFRSNLIGYYDGDLVMLDPTRCDEYIGESLRKGGVTLGASRQAILRALAKKDMIVYKRRDTGNGIGETTRVCRMGRVQQRMIVMYRWALEGREPPTPEQQGFTPIDGEQLPMEFRDK